MILDDILKNKADEIDKLKFKYAHEIHDLYPSSHSLEEKLKDNKMSYIFEYKKASPSKGIINENADIHEVVNIYKHYASAISVLTDKSYFQGDYQFIKEIRKELELPILCKDFIIDPFQIKLARYMGADAILLMLSVLSDEDYNNLSECAQSLEMDIITEVHSEEELQRALKFKARIIGINNRDFRDLSVDSNYTRKLLPLIPDGQLVISESGFENYHQIKQYEKEIHGVLIGSSVMASKSIKKKVQELVYNRIKICGIKTVEQAYALQKFPLSYIGYIFAEKSKRKIEKKNFFSLKSNSDIKQVAVFQDQNIDEIQDTLSFIHADIIQVHGREDDHFINQLKSLYPDKEIWKSYQADQKEKNTSADRKIFDSGHGGTGKKFDWELVEESHRNEAILAGGLSKSNINEAMKQNYFAYDINSGVERIPGVKSLDKIHSLFEQIRIKSK